MAISPAFPQELGARIKEVAKDNANGLYGFTAGSILTGTIFLLQRRYQRFPTSGWITPNVYAGKRWLRGVVVNVGDADNFRLYHTPGIGWNWPLKFRRIPSTSKDLKDQTLHIRIAGVDAPEAAHFGRPAQPYATESLQWLKEKIQGRTVYCRVLRPDQYSRIVANVILPPKYLPCAFSLGKSIALEMLRSGWATTYEQSGAEYEKLGKYQYVNVEEEAKAARRGMWKSGTGGETPAEYKRRFSRSSGIEAVNTSETVDQNGKHPPNAARGLFGRFWKKLW